MTDYPTLRLDLSNLAHSLGARHSEASYFRPQYYSALCEGLSKTSFSGLRRLVLEELLEAIETNAKVTVPQNLYNLLWLAFGVERIDSRTNVMGRSRAAKQFYAFLQVKLPVGVVRKAKQLHAAAPTEFQARILNLPEWTVSPRFQRNQLSAFETVEALARWKQGEPASNVELFQRWITNTIYSQVKYRFTIGVSDGVEFDDVLQDVIAGVLQRLCVYQPNKAKTLERWLFATMVNGVRMAVRKYGDQYFRVHKSDGEEIFVTPEVSAEDELDGSRTELIEYAIAKLSGIDKRGGVGNRVSALLDFLDVFLEVKPANAPDELREQLQSLFPSFSSTAVEQIVALSDFNTNEEGVSHD